MAQPEFVPQSAVGKSPAVEELPPPLPWRAQRPGEISNLKQPVGAGFGNPGPDQGYALKIVRNIEREIKVGPSEDINDAVVGIVAVAMARSALFGRAPVIHDLRHAANLFGFIGTPPTDLKSQRVMWFAALSHDYGRQRALVDSVHQSALRMDPQAIADKVAAGEWRELIKPIAHH